MSIKLGERVPRESEILRAIGDYLAYNKVFFWRANNTPIWGKSNDGKMRWRAMPKYSSAGVPDIIAIVKGKFIGLEVKRPNLPLKPLQSEFGTKLIINGGFYYKVCSIDDVKNIKILWE